MPGTADLTAGLISLHLEGEIGARNENLLELRARSRALMLHACAHSVFFCQLLLRARQQLHTDPLIAPRIPPGLHVGIIGGGHLGKRLVHGLISLTEIPAHHIRVSTRRPDTLSEIRALGVHCSYDNSRLVRQSQLVFLCCLPSQLPAVCAEIGGHLADFCVVYSLVSTTPISRLKILLSQSNVIRPEYQTAGSAERQDLGGPRTLTEALRDGSFVKATIPGGPQCGGGVHIISSFMEAALYAVLNMCTSHGLSRDQSLRVLNSLIQRLVPQGPFLTQGDRHQGPLFTAGHFVSEEFASSQPEDSPFPRFDLSRVQMKRTPLSQHLAASPQLREMLSDLYRSTLCGPRSTTDPSIV